MDAEIKANCDVLDDTWYMKQISLTYLNWLWPFIVHIHGRHVYPTTLLGIVSESFAISFE